MSQEKNAKFTEIKFVFLCFTVVYCEDVFIGKEQMREKIKSISFSTLAIYLFINTSKTNTSCKRSYN